ncbi:GGDEF domain-containing protein [Acinetobacter sp. TGL-Y2]|uniref:GGDEF domain-containing protein n=1 Tax=Acinetobacter sp. TGL-Y2 TaxID=1407071 RepID=UPI0022435843|nr:GGDEF domain-containing protein [Acinetobacter sp. TGL-Y2]
MNDTYGHDVGDQILKRFGNILSLAITNTTYSVSRIGGDEFVILMPSADDQDVQKMLSTLDSLVYLDNQKNLNFPISVAMGYSTTQNNESIEDLLKRADQTMYINKNKYYASNSNRRS